MARQPRPELIEREAQAEAAELGRPVAQERPRRGPEPGLAGAELAAGALDPGAQPVGQPLGQIVEALRRLAEQRLRVGQTAGEPDQVLLELPQLALAAMEQALIELAEALGELGAHRHGELGGRGRRGRALVGGVIDQRGVGLVADRRDQRDRASRRGAHHDLLVERPEVLERAAAAGDDQHVGARQRAARRKTVEALDRGRDLGRGELALDQDRPQQHPAREALRQTVEDVLEHRTRGRGHDADHLGQEGQGPFSLGGEQPLGGELLAALLEQRHQRPDPGRRQAVDDQLVLRAARIGRDPPARHHLEPVLGLEAQPLRGAPPAHPVEARPGVLEREVDMPRARLPEPRDLAPHPDIAIGVLERPLERVGQLADRELADVVEVHPSCRWLRSRPAAMVGHRATPPGALLRPSDRRGPPPRCGRPRGQRVDQIPSMRYSEIRGRKRAPGAFGEPEKRNKPEKPAKINELGFQAATDCGRLGRCRPTRRPGRACPGRVGRCG